jgi:hypothetical protein
MNVEIGAEAALFPEKEYISGIFVAVHTVDVTSMQVIRYGERNGRKKFRAPCFSRREGGVK